MTTTPEDNLFARALQQFAPQSKLLRSWPLTGGVSAQVTALEIEQPDGHLQKLIVRQHGAVDLQHNPQIAADEFKLLHLVRAAGVPAPMPYYFDQSGETFSTPYIVIEYIEGETVFAPANLPDFLRQCAAQLARIHQIDGEQADVAFLPQQARKYATRLREHPMPVDESFAEAHLLEMLEAAWPIPQRNRSVLLHGDFWPGNLLWKDGQLVAVIDWEDAAIGDPLADVANSRLEILWAFGSVAMQQFTQQYQALTTVDFSYLPYWDLCAALRLANFATWAADAHAEQKLRAERQWFINQALEALSAVPFPLRGEISS